jgi:hypothetical protein
LAELEGRLSPATAATAKERGQTYDLQAIIEKNWVKQNET